MQPARDVTARGTLRVLGPGDRDRIARIAAAAFGGIEFYVTVLGLDAERQRRFFGALFHLMLRDSRARVYGLERDGRLVAATALVFAGFPQPRNALNFLWTLLRELGLLWVLRYLRFVRAYDRVMRPAPGDAAREVRAYWLFVDPEAMSVRHGSELVRRTLADVESQGWGLVTGFVDASNTLLLAFYRRFGFTVTDPFPFLGCRGARITLRLPRHRAVET
ncbi:MAG: hypothetical protein IH616_04305, partial [Gemmatimonadales bacterium]|nr:hypothetical protein [Gemmatimonadales bacterium]